MASRRYFNNAQPQTLQIALFLLYFHAAFGVLAMVQNRVWPWDMFGTYGTTRQLYAVLQTARVAGAFAAYGIANERKWSYVMAVVVAVIPLAIYAVYSDKIPFDILTLMFEIALAALLLHPQSRDYQRIWFK